jgi:hypothetical protein
MPVSKTVEAPEWIESGATPTGGLDLLGLRLPVQTIGLSLLNGVTTVTPSIRYIAIRACSYTVTARPSCLTAPPSSPDGLRPLNVHLSSVTCYRIAQ